MAQDKDIGHLNFNLGPSEEFPVPGAAGEDTRPMEAVMEQAREDLHLAADHGLIAVKAYIKDEGKAKKKTAAAERQERFQEKKKAEGLVKTFVPATVAEAVKATEGGFDAWLQAERTKAVEAAQVQRSPTTPATPAAPAPAPKVAPQALTAAQVRLIAIGDKVEKLQGWRRSLALWLIQ